MQKSSSTLGKKKSQWEHLIIKSIQQTSEHWRLACNKNFPGLFHTLKKCCSVYRQGQPFPFQFASEKLPNKNTSAIFAPMTTTCKVASSKFLYKSLLMKLLQLHLPVNLIRSAILMSCDICSNDANQDYCSRTYGSNSNSEG